MGAKVMDQISFRPTKGITRLKGFHPGISKDLECLLRASSNLKDQHLDSSSSDSVEPNWVKRFD